MGVGNDADDSNTDDVRRASLGRIIIIIVAAVDATNNISEPVVAVGVAEFSEMTQKWWSGVAMMLDSHLQKIWRGSALHIITLTCHQLPLLIVTSVMSAGRPHRLDAQSAS